MDRTEEDMKLVGFFGTFKQSFKTIFSSTKIFYQITLTLILPLSIIFLAHIEISHHFFEKIEDNYLPYDSNFHNVTLADWLYFWLFKIIYFTFLTLFSLLSTAAVVFTVACIYTDREFVFRHVIRILPNVWRKLAITFVFIYFAFFIYNVITGVVVVILRSIFGYSTFSGILSIIIFIFYAVGLLYLTFVWQLASVATVLENCYGFKAMKKGKTLANGKKAVGMGIAFVFYVILVGLIFAYQVFVEFGGYLFKLAIVWRVMIGVLCTILLTILFLVFIVNQTMVYLVCKSYHREAIDKLSLSTFLSVYTAETVVFPKPGEEIQLGRAQPPAAAEEV